MDPGELDGACGRPRRRLHGDHGLLAVGYTATDNEPMLALNRDLGFFVADTMTALEKKDDHPRM